MIPYILLFICVFFCSLMEIYKQRDIIFKFDFVKKTMKSLYVMLPVLLILLLGIFRETSVGYDSEVYRIYYWDRIDTYSWRELLTDFSMDNGFYLLLKVIAVFTDDWWLCRAVIFVITFGMYYRGIEKDTPYPSMSLLIFCGLSILTLSFSILRQAIAGAICLYSYRQCQKGSLTRGILLILIASTFHKLAFMCLLIPVIFIFLKKKISGLKLIVLSILSMLVFAVLIPIVSSMYADGLYENSTYSEGGFGKLFFIIVVIIYVIYLHHRTIKKALPEDAMFNISCCSLFVQLGALQWGLLTRCVSIFSVFWCMLIPQLINKLPPKERLLHFGIVAILFGFMFFYQINDVDLYIFHHF